MNKRSIAQMSIAMCDGCGAPVCFGAEFCAYCRGPLEWTDRPRVLPGDDIVSVDFRRAQPPKGSPGTHTPDGLDVRPRPSSFEHFVVTRPLRNACVAIRGVAMDAVTNLGLLVRIAQQDAVRTGYEVRVYPALRSFHARRLAWSAKRTYEHELRPWEYTPSIAPPGTPNELELRYADSIFEIWINGRRAATFLDAGFGYGTVAWKVGAMRAEPGRMLLQSLVVRRAR